MGNFISTRFIKTKTIRINISRELSLCLLIMKTLFNSPDRFINSEIVVFGRVKNYKTLSKNLGFILLRTPDGTIQIVFTGNLPKINLESILKVTGCFRKNSSVKQGLNGYEVEAIRCEVLNEASDIPYFSDEEPPSRAFRIKHRHLDLRRPRISAIFKIRSVLIQSSHHFLEDNNFLCVTTPRITGGLAEGPVATLKVDYFGQSASLTLASVLYHGLLISGDLDRVYEIGPLFNGENNKTSKSANEFTALEYAAAYFSRDDMMNFTQKYFVSMLDMIESKCAHELELLKIDIKTIPKTFSTITYAEALEFLNKNGFKLEWAKNHELPSESIPVLCKKFNGFFWLIDQPEQQKWFFVKSVNNNGIRICRDFQLWHSTQPRLAEGSERITDFKDAEERIKLHGLNINNFNYYLNALKHGIPPFSGMGLGIERILMFLLNISNIREIILFPRDPQTLEP